MTVYVDDAYLPYGRMLMSHMVSDDINELHAMAAAIGVRRKWFQGEASTPHYDVCKAKRAEAVRLGAVELDRRGMARWLRERRKKS